MFNLNNGQKEAVKSLLSFLKSNQKLYLLEGSAGTGKSTVITYLLQNDFYSKKKIAFTATTNKAVSVLQSLITTNNNIVLSTIHKLLKFKRKIDSDGSVAYYSSLEDSLWELNNNKYSIYYFDIIIIDEASMISKSMLSKIVQISNMIKGKIIFVGDRSQLPPINEEISNVFTSNFTNSYLTEVMRNKDTITDFANELKLFLEGKDNKIKIKKFVNSNFLISKEYTDFYDNYIKSFKNNKKPIMLSYTNNQCNLHNQKIRQILFNTQEKYVIGDLIVFNSYYSNSGHTFNTSQQEIITDKTTFVKKIKNLNFAELINLKSKVELKADVIKDASGTEINCPICYEDSVDFTVQTQCNHYFCSRCIKLWLEKNKECPMCRMSLKNSTKDILIKDDTTLTEMLKKIRDDTKDIEFKCYNITLGENGSIVVIHEDDLLLHKNTIKFIHSEMNKLKAYIDKSYNNNFGKILLSRMWEHYYESFYDLFANINYGYCITVHKSQGSTFKYVFTDMKNIVSKNYVFKAKYQCLYTAITRASETLFIVL